ncbi:EF-hand domain-containing protein [Sphingomonas aerophila]|uniref:EF-hand domain-containing protein n=1 Tax=Sphingomonas aerophila TaxID=1344948 RepID=A0A7W9BFK1_9SPHN|nr:hypothetical protein [Sphingomonas aerophila]
MTILLSLLLAAAAQEVVPDVRVTGPGRPNSQTPATLVVEPAAMLIVSCDTDADGRTTRTELEACLRGNFDAIDTAHRGQIGYIDYGRWQTMWLGDQGALPSPFEVDRDGDNRVTTDELLAQFNKLFARFDKNGDKAVTRAEALTVRATAADARGPVGGRGKRGGANRPKPERVPGGRPGEGAPDEQP